MKKKEIYCVDYWFKF